MSIYTEVEVILEQYRQALNSYQTFKELISLQKEEIIEEMCLAASTISDVPRSVTNAFNSKTENATINIDKKMNYTKFELAMYEENRKEEERIRQRLNDLRTTVYNMLITLSSENRFIILALYIHKMSYNQVFIEVVKKFKNSAVGSKNGVRYRRDDILKEMQKNLRKNK